VLVGPDGELDADPESARALAAALAKAGTNAILDLSDLEPDGRCRFVAEFFDGLFFLPKGDWRSRFVFLDEAQEFAPQSDVLGAQADSLRAVVRIAAMGRKRGLCLVAASQRVAKVSKNVTAECNNRLIGRFAEDTDLKRAADLLGIGKAKWRQLQSLQPGQFYAYGPAFNFDGVQLVRSGPVLTTHPKRGARHLLKTPAPSSAIAAVVEQLRALQRGHKVEAKASAEDAEHRADQGALVAKLQAELDALKAESLANVEEAYGRGYDWALKAAREPVEETLARARQLVGELVEKLEALDEMLRLDPFADMRPGPMSRRPSERVSAPTPAPPPAPPPRSGQAGETIGDSARDRMIHALLQYEGPIPRARVAALAMIKLGGSTWRGALAKLRQEHLVQEEGELLAASDHARNRYCGRVAPLPTGDELVAHWQRTLGTGAAARLFYQLTVGGGQASRKLLAERAGLELGGSTWRGALAKLRTLGLVVDHGKDALALSHHLYYG
jgi:hypothetical protein